MTYIHIHHVFHTNHVQELSHILPPFSSIYCIHSIKCPRLDGKKYYTKYVLDGTCPRCNGFSLLTQNIHESDNDEFQRMVVDMKRFKYVTYEVDGGKERKYIELVMS
jgi:hypothetical protein